MEASKSEAIQSFIQGQQEEFYCKLNVSPTLRFDLKNAKKRSNSGRIKIYSLFCQENNAWGTGGRG
jgi:sulfur relay (sulfurtransferase) DsrC/TusE family protein